jgi:isopenicillin-N N-acyltransferase-like protein
MSTFPSFSAASADPFERGRQLGAASARFVHESVDVYRETFTYYAKLDWDQVRELAAAFREPITAYDEQIMREMDGLAAGAGVEPEDILAVNARTEIMFGVASRVGPSECTSFFVGPSASADGHVLVGQNWDWRTRCAESTILAEVDQGPDRPAFVMLAEGGLVGKLGYNAAGIGVVTNAMISDRDKGQIGVPFHVVLRGLLNATTLEEALAAIVRAPRAASANYLIASATGHALDVETGPGGVETVFLTQPTADLLAHSNHYTCAIPFADVGAATWDDSSCRIDVMRRFLDDHRGELSRELVVEVLRDHEGHPHSLCRHPDEAAPVVEQAMTVGSWVIDLTDLVSDIAAGPPCETPYEELTPAFARRALASTRPA